MLNGCNHHDEFVLDASSGTYNSQDIGEPSDTHSLKAVLAFSEFKHDGKWPPAVYIGFHEGDDKNNSFQFLIMRNKIEDDYIVAGYRIIENGEEVQVKSVKQFGLHDEPSVDISFNEGEASISVDGDTAIKIKTKLKLVKPYISVSSCTGKIIIKS